MVSRLSSDKIHILCDTRVLIIKLQHFFYRLARVRTSSFHHLFAAQREGHGKTEEQRNKDDVKSFELTALILVITFRNYYISIDVSLTFLRQIKQKKKCLVT